MPNRPLHALTAVLVAAFWIADCAAQPGWKPVKNVEFIVGVSPGGGIDRTARTLQKVLHDKRMLEVSATVVNKPCFDSTGRSPVFISRKHPVPYVFLASPARKHVCPTSAAC